MSQFKGFIRLCFLKPSSLLAIFCVLVGGMSVGVGEVFAESVVDDEAEVRLDELEPFQPHLQVVEAFVSLHSGPAKGYPVFTVVERGEWLQVLKRKTDWLMVRDRSGRTGWMSVTQASSMIDANGKPFTLGDVTVNGERANQWEAGLLSGEFDHSALINLYLGYWWTNHISSELSVEQVLSDASELIFVTANLNHQPFPDWRVSPYFSLGAGKVFINPKATLADVAQRDEEMMSAAFGIRYYLSKRYFIRAEVRDYKIFTNRENNEEATEWKIGLSIMF